MFVTFILLTSALVMVRARNLNTETIKHHAPTPKHDFSSHEVHFIRNGREELSDGFKDHGDRDFHDHGSFNMEFDRRQFPHSDNGKEDRRDSGSSMHDYGPELSKSEFHDFNMSGFSNRDSDHSSRGKKHKERTNHTTESRDVGLETFESETKVKDSNVEDSRNVDKKHKSKSFQSNYDIQHYSPDLGFGNIEEHFQGFGNSNNFGERRNINRSFIQNNNMYGTNFNSNFFNSQPEFNDRETDDQNTKKFGVQIQGNEKYFDTIASSHSQKPHHINSRRSQSQKNRQNVGFISTSNSNNRTSARIQHKVKADNEFVTTVAPKRNPTPSSRDNYEMDQRPIFQTSPKPMVNNSQKGTNSDIWVWSEGTGNKPPSFNSTSTEPSLTTPSLADRAAFTGDKCPTGSVRVGTICASVD